MSYLIIFVFLLTHESLVYDVKYGPFRIGYISVETKEVEDSLIRINLVTETEGVFFTIFPIKDELLSLVKKGTFKPVYFEKKIREGRYRDTQRIKFNELQAIYNEKDTITMKEKDFFDPLGLYLLIRSLDLKPNDSLYITVHNNKKNHKVRVIVRESENKNLIHVIPQIIEPRTKPFLFEILIERETRKPLMLFLNVNSLRFAGYLRE